MRLPRHAFASLALLVLAGCSSGSVLDDFRAEDISTETTGSVVADAPQPQAEVGGAGGQSAAVGYADPDALDEPGLAAIAMAAPALRPAVQRASFGDSHPIDFGRITPGDHAVHGVDVSRWQGDIDWAKLRRQGANFVFIKATDGGDHLDPAFKKNWNDAHRAGLKRGAYHFFYWCRTASSQADWFIRNVPKVDGALPPVLDVEWNHQSSCRKRPPRAVVLEKMQVFMDRLEAHYGQRPIIYTAPDFYDDNLKGAFPNHPFWLRSVAEHPAKRYPGRDWVFWQYSGSGLSKGVEGNIDLNVFHGDEKAWWKWLGKVSRPEAIAQAG